MGRFVAEVLQPKVVLTGYDIFGHTRCLSEALWQTGITRCPSFMAALAGLDSRDCFITGPQDMSPAGRNRMPRS